VIHDGLYPGFLIRKNRVEGRDSMAAWRRGKPRRYDAASMFDVFSHIEWEPQEPTPSLYEEALPSTFKRCTARRICLRRTSRRLGSFHRLSSSPRCREVAQEISSCGSGNEPRRHRTSRKFQLGAHLFAEGGVSCVSNCLQYESTAWPAIHVQLSSEVVET
jgi:hypothetical protein